MIEISLTDFVDFVIKAGTPKLTKVKQIIHRGPYLPSLDYWKQAREGIKKFHENGSNDKENLNQIYTGLKDRKKLVNYFRTIKAYKKFLGNKTFDWFHPESTSWSSGDLLVRVNPELGLLVNGQKHLVKLYFKDEKLQRSKIKVIFELMKVSLPDLSDVKMSILDITNSKLITMRDSPSDLNSLLIGEASSFVHIWHSLTKERVS